MRDFTRLTARERAVCEQALTALDAAGPTGTIMIIADEKSEVRQARMDEVASLVKDGRAILVMDTAPEIRTVEIAA